MDEPTQKRYIVVCTASKTRKPTQRQVHASTPEEAWDAIENDGFIVKSVWEEKLRLETQVRRIKVVE